MPVLRNSEKMERRRVVGVSTSLRRIDNGSGWREDILVDDLNRVVI